MRLQCVYEIERERGGDRERKREREGERKGRGRGGRGEEGREGREGERERVKVTADGLKEVVGEGWFSTSIVAVRE